MADDRHSCDCLAMQSVADAKGYEAMSVYRERGRWRYRSTAYYSNGKSVRINGSAPKHEDTKQKALQMEREHCERMRAMTPGKEEPTQDHAASATEPAKPTVPTVAEYGTTYLDSARIDAKPSAFASKEGIWRTHIVPHLGDRRLDEVTYAVIEDFKLSLAKTRCRNTKAPRTLSPKTLNNVLVVLSHALQVARKRNLIATVPEIDWVKLPPQEFDFLGFEEADRLITAADGQWGTMIAVALRTGLRQGELLGLRWIDVDLSAGRLTVRQNYVDGLYVTPKSGKPREVPLSEGARLALQAHRHERGPLVFCDAAGSVLSDGKMERPLKRAYTAASLRPIGWHTLRHTFASHLAMRGVPLKVIQELLGHASIVTTQRYAHLAPHVARDAVKLLDRAPSAASGGQLATDWQNQPTPPVSN
jgi:integrase